MVTSCIRMAPRFPPREEGWPGLKIKIEQRLRTIARSSCRPPACAYALTMRCRTETMESLLAFGQNQSIAIIHRFIIPPRPDSLEVTVWDTAYYHCETLLSLVESSSLFISEGETR